MIYIHHSFILHLVSVQEDHGLLFGPSLGSGDGQVRGRFSAPFWGGTQSIVILMWYKPVVNPRTFINSNKLT